jgi:plasmid stabilization system protein ParE
MDFKVLIADSAIADLKEIVEFVAADNPEAASRLGEKLLGHALSLGSLPERFPFLRQTARNPQNAGIAFSDLLQSRRRSFRSKHFALLAWSTAPTRIWHITKTALGNAPPLDSTIRSRTEPQGCERHRWASRRAERAGTRVSQSFRSFNQSRRGSQRFTWR